MLGTEANTGSGGSFVPRANGSAANSEATAGIVHDLGNLIQIATAAVNIIARNPRVHATDLEPVLAGAQTSLERAGALVRRTVGLMRERSAAAEPVNLASCLEEIEALTRITWEHRLDVTISPDVPLVRCERLALQTAILNVLLNARDAMPGGGVISIHGSTPKAFAPFVELRVTDSGIGMKPETIKRAFEPFFTTKPDGLGGLGLPMVRRFAEDAGGQVSIDSEFGVGTTVTLHLPALNQSSRRVVANGP
jgi:signal transduction histidine kinase